MIKNVLSRIVNFLARKRRNIFFFLIPNFCNRKKIKYHSFPYCHQKTIITGKGKVEIGKNCSFGFKLGGFNYKGVIEIQPRFEKATIIIGNNVATNNNICIIAANKIEIGDETLIGQNVTIMDFEAHAIDPKKRRSIGEIGKIIIQKNVWIGNNVIILKDTYIGENSIVAAGAIVKGHFPANVVIGGIPAKIIKEIL